MSPGQPKSVQERIAAIVGGMAPPQSGTGPIKTLLDNEPFDRVCLLSNYPPDINRRIAKCLGRDVEVHEAGLANVTDYGEIFQVADREMKAFTTSIAGSYELSLLLSPGTPAMAAVWVLLGKSKYPATFWQTFEGKAWKTDIPFDLAVDYVPELLRGPDSFLQHLASKSPQEVEGFEAIIGNSRAIRLAVGRARKAALRDVPVLLMGESGTGKEMFARAIHAASHRRGGPFVAINCAAIPRELLESELFGHKKGAFTGAVKDRAGAFKQAEGGIIFLDEVGECDPVIQAKLLRVLQPLAAQGPCVREYLPVGAEEPERGDVRVIAATNRNLLAAAQSGQFREDLYYRLAVISIKLPALRERKSDIPLLAGAILDRVNRDFSGQEPGYRHKKLSASATAFVKRCAWPGNVRELHNSLVQAAVMAEGDELGADDLAAAVAEMSEPSGKLSPLEEPLGDGFDLEKHLENIQRHYLQRAMIEAHGVKARAARLLGMKNYQTLDGQLKRLGVGWKL
jgi:transcriptional regulator with PAS, ATPase and Fis domain